MTPTFLIIGAAKAGTTAVYRYLQQHPEIYMSTPKEPHFMAFAGSRTKFRGPGDEESINQKMITDYPSYLALFSAASGIQAVGEASVSTLYYPRSIDNIKRYAPNTKIIVILRNPVERAYSSFLYMIRERWEPEKNFARALDLEESRIRQGWHHIWHYQAMGLYSAQLARFTTNFPEEQMSIYLYDDLKREPLATVQDMFRFLGVQPSFEPDLSHRPHASGVPRSTALQDFLVRTNPVKSMLKALTPDGLRRRLRERVEHANLERPELDEESRQRLIHVYEEDVAVLSEALSRDLQSWLQ